MESYRKFILLVNTSKQWKVARFIIHWLTIPLKLTLIAINSLLLHIYHLPFLKKRPPKNIVSDDVKKERFLKVFNNLPVYDNGTMQLYTLRVSHYSLPDGNNHNMDHQCLRHGVYSFIMNQIEKGNDKINIALNRHMWKSVLLRGYRENGEYNASSVSGDMLVGLCLAMTNAYKNPKVRSTEGTTFDNLKDSFDELLHGIIENDYSLLEIARQDEDEIQSKVWDEEYKKNNERIEKVKVKSSRGMWHPGLETVGAQALTLLAAVRVGDKIVGSSYAKKEYKKLLWTFGYGLLSLFPTTYIPSKRGHYNESNCMILVYVLHKLSDSKLGKLYWKLIGFYIWSLSYPYYNAFLTGLFNDMAPGWLSKKYLEDCVSYLYEEDPLTYSGEGGVKYKPETYPVPYNDQDRDEFHFDKDPTVLKEYTEKTKSGLSLISGAIMLDLIKVKTWLQ